MRALIPIFALFVLLATPGVAQAPSDDRAPCLGENSSLPAGRIVASCSALIEAGGLTNLERARILSRRAIGYRVQRDHVRALADYDAALVIDPEFDWAHAGRGAVLRDRGDPALAIPAYDEAIRLTLRGLALFEPGSEDHAFESRRLAWGYFGRAIAYALLQNHSRAVVDLREAIAREPGDPDMANGLCWSLAVSDGDLVEARAACETSLRIRLGHGPTLDSRAMVSLKQRRFQDAWNDYDAAVRGWGDQPHLATPLFGRGIAALRLGRTAEGRVDLARAAAMNPEIAQFYARYGVEP